MQPYDIFIAGGGINGAGIARDAAGRGYSVCLCEQGDLASGTSSASTKLIHGGLRYLEHYEFRLVREALIEREILWVNAPHIIRPLRFLLPVQKGMRPAWLLRLGLFIYDHLGGRKLLPGTRTINLQAGKYAEPLVEGFAKGFEYSDCAVNDARLVVLNARDAADRGAHIKTRSKVMAAKRVEGLWQIEIETAGGESELIEARLLVNATGPWVDQFLERTETGDGIKNIRQVQGSHIIVKRHFAHDHGYIFQNGDGRIFFAIPYERDFTLIGTTDHDFSGDPLDAKITDGEIDYLCEAASKVFSDKIRPKDIVRSYAGVRSLFEDGSTKAQHTTRDYVLQVKSEGDSAPLINIFGGKITTYRRLALSALEKIETLLGQKKPAWTQKAALPGGDFPADGFDQQVLKLRASYPFLTHLHASRLLGDYGTRADLVLQDASRLSDLGRLFGGTLHEAEVRYLSEHEWAVTAQDILWRRTRQGLVFSTSEVEALAQFMEHLSAQSETDGVNNRSD